MIEGPPPCALNPLVAIHVHRKGSLLATTAMLHGVATNITGPYEWQTWPDMV
eukprot:SAG31_NODE_306_length_17979_cov_7.825447_12_plen_52_part_00